MLRFEILSRSKRGPESDHFMMETPQAETEFYQLVLRGGQNLPQDTFSSVLNVSIPASDVLWICLS
ncbi:hypothetical protein CHARACLAT_013012, partial [Characodon lateralis]|nr:hypothetical protein [Characodon lateralis]